MIQQHISNHIQSMDPLPSTSQQALSLTVEGLDSNNIPSQE